jgi:poly(3-hydroxybutyrate) depolymerase
VSPPLGGSSGGTGGPAPVSGAVKQAGGVTYRLIVPASYAPSTPAPFLVAYSGTEGGAQMTSNLQQVASFTGTAGFLEAVLDGVTYNGDGAAGATVLDAVRAEYNVDNDRTYLLGESAGTTAAEELGFHLRQSFFAAYWANDVNAVDGPAEDAASLGFAPWGQVGPGGQFATADAIVANMQGAGYRLPNPAPYAGQGAGTHGDPNQFIAAISWFPGKNRL